MCISVFKSVCPSCVKIPVRYLFLWINWLNCIGSYSFGFNSCFFHDTNATEQTDQKHEPSRQYFPFGDKRLWIYYGLLALRLNDSLVSKFRPRALTSLESLIYPQYCFWGIPDVQKVLRELHSIKAKLGSLSTHPPSVRAPQPLNPLPASLLSAPAPASASQEPAKLLPASALGLACLVPSLLASCQLQPLSRQATAGVRAAAISR